MVNDTFMPSLQGNNTNDLFSNRLEIQWAKAIVKKYEELSSQKGAFEHEGMVIDWPGTNPLNVKMHLMF